MTLLPAATATALFNIKIFPAVTNWIQLIWQGHTENSLKNLESTTAPKVHTDQTNIQPANYKI
jgi:hypothetical protein